MIKLYLDVSDVILASKHTVYGNSDLPVKFCIYCWIYCFMMKKIILSKICYFSLGFLLCVIYSRNYSNYRFWQSLTVWTNNFWVLTLFVLRFLPLGPLASHLKQCLHCLPLFFWHFLCPYPIEHCKSFDLIINFQCLYIFP